MPCIHGLHHGCELEALKRITRQNRPLYIAVRQEIESRIRSGKYKPDTPLPSVVAFAAELKVSTITIRRALSDLQNAGLLRSVPGLGTYVNVNRRFVRHLSISRDPLYGAYEEASQLGKTARVQVLSVELRDPQDPAFEIFGLSPTKHICINKLFMIDEEPIALEHTFIATPASQELIDEFSRDLLYRAMRRLGMKVKKNRLYLDAAPAPPDLARHLGVPVGYPTFRHFYNPLVEGGNPLVYGVSISPFERIAFTFDISL